MECLEDLGDAEERLRLRRALLAAQKAALAHSRPAEARALLAAVLALGGASRETRWLSAYLAMLMQDHEAGRRLFDELQLRGEDISPARPALVGCLQALADPRWESVARGLL